MAENEKVIGIKCSSESTLELQQFKYHGSLVKNGDFIVFNCPDEQFLAGRMIGADSGIGGTYGVMPELFLKLDEVIKNKQIKEAQVLQNEINEVIKQLLSFSSLYGVAKHILELRGIKTGSVRGHMLHITSEDDKKRCAKLNEEILELVNKYY